jgi:hypothetical protein
MAAWFMITFPIAHGGDGSREPLELADILKQKV